MDLTILFAEAIGTDLATIARVLMWLLAIALVRTALAKAGADRGLVAARDWLARRRVAARATRTGVDDAMVHAGSYVLEGVALVLTVGAMVVELVAWITPRFALGMQMAREQLEDKAVRRRRPPSSLLGLLTWAILALGVAVLLLGPMALTGCGPTQAQTLHSGLNTTTDYADPLYALAVVSCDAAEGQVIASHAPSEREAAAAALVRVRLECDRVFAGFEEARALQLALRATADAMEDGRATMSDVLRSADELALVVESTRTLVSALRARVGGAQ